MPDKVIVTGGFIPYETTQETPLVSKYDHNGWVENMPTLNTGRFDHACGYYINTDGLEVKSKVRRNNLLNKCRCTLWWEDPQEDGDCLQQSCLFKENPLGTVTEVYHLNTILPVVCELFPSIMMSLF